MLEHHSSSEQNPSQNAYVTPTTVPSAAQESLSPTVSVQNEKIEARIEDFLDRVFARLVAVLPYEERQRRRAEMREQLDAMIAAHIELGTPPELALEYALTQFQRENAITAQAAPTLLQTQTATKTPLPSARPATLIALGAFGLPYLADATKWAWNLWSAHSSSETAFYRVELLAVPLIAGLATGLLARKRAVRGVLNAIGLISIPALLPWGFLCSLIYMGFLSDQGARWSWVPSPMPGLVGITWWAGMGCLGAGVGGKLRTGITTGWKRLTAARRIQKRGSVVVERPPFKTGFASPGKLTWKVAKDERSICDTE